MKNKAYIFKLTIIFLVSVSLLSCDSFLDRQEDEALTLKKVYSSRSTTYRAWLQTMSYFPNQINEYQYEVYTGASDEATIAYNYDYRKMNFGTWTASNQAGSRYVNMYRAIRDCNTFLNNLDNCKDPLLTEYERELWRIQTRFARAYYYFMLMQDHGPVFLIGNEVIDFNQTLDQLERERNTWEECVKYVEDELKVCVASSAMPLTYRSDDEKGLATKGACLAILSRLKLYSARPLFNGNSLYAGLKNSKGENLFPQTFSVDKWKQAVEAAKSVIDLNVYKLFVDPTGNPFKSLDGIYKNPWNVELIFSNAGNADLRNLGMVQLPTGLKGWGGVGPTQQQVDAYAMENGVYPITGYMEDGSPIIDPMSGYIEIGKSKFANPAAKANGSGSEFASPASQQRWPNMYKGREPRFYMHVFWSDSYWQHGPGNADFTLISFAKGGNANHTHDYPKSGYLLRKFYRPELNAVNGTFGRMCFPTFRYGEIYLNFIEAALEYERHSGSNDYRTTAMSYWDELRARAGMPPIIVAYPGASLERLIELVRNERRIELAFEWHRYYDTRTWMIAEQTDAGPMYGMNPTVPAPSATATPETFWRRTVFETRVFEKKNYLYPFNQSEMDRNKKIVQNYGW